MLWFSVIFYLLLFDAISANILSFAGKQHWWQTNLGIIAKHFPLARGWTVYYLCLVSLMGIILLATNELVVPFE